jgi:hypothetical protein
MALLEGWAENHFQGTDQEINKGRVQDLKDVIEYILRDFEYIQPEGEESQHGD